MITEKRLFDEKSEFITLKMFFFLICSLSWMSSSFTKMV